MSCESARRFCCWRPLALLSVLAITAGLLGCAANGYRFIVPEGFAGWVRIDFGIPTSPRLPVQEGFLVVRVPRDGIIQTSDSIRTSPKRDEFYQDMAGDGLVKAPANLTSFTVQSLESVRARDERVTLYVFFGTQEDLRRAEQKRDDKGHPVPGQLH